MNEGNVLLALFLWFCAITSFMGGLRFQIAKLVKKIKELKKMNKIRCNNCQHFYITYKKNFPYGCKAFGVISKKIPYLEVLKISGTNCALFSKKNKNVNIKKKGMLA